MNIKATELLLNLKYIRALALVPSDRFSIPWSQEGFCIMLKGYKCL